MGGTRQQFIDCIVGILSRYARQSAVPAPSFATLSEIASRLWATIESVGLPPPLRSGETGAPGEMRPERVTPLLAQITDGLSLSGFEEPVRQLLKACFHPEFRNCRDSYREVHPDGSCRRQNLARARVRVSGSHCIDCPHWVALTPHEHDELLAAFWCGELATLTANKSIFLPEDFRALRRLLYEHARRDA